MSLPMHARDRIINSMFAAPNNNATTLTHGIELRRIFEMLSNQAKQQE